MTREISPDIYKRAQIFMLIKKIKKKSQTASIYNIILGFLTKEISPN
jgi:hypothetical protein